MNGSALSAADKWDHQITMERGPQCTTACTRRKREAKLAQIGGRPARQAPPHQGRTRSRKRKSYESRGLRRNRAWQSPRYRCFWGLGSPIKKVMLEG